MSQSLRTPSVLRAALLAATLSAPLIACAQTSAPIGSGSSTPPANAAATQSDVVGAGGPIDEVYREIYTPGDPRWSGEWRTP